MEVVGSNPTEGSKIERFFVEEKKILQETVDYDKDAWVTSPDPDFKTLYADVRAPENWVSFETVATGRYAKEVIKPLSNYNSVLVPPPELKSIVGNIVTLRYRTFADIYVIDKGESGNFYNVDRPWVRQYYMTAKDYPVPEDAWSKTYKFYTPWFLDYKVEVTYKPIFDEETPFYVQETRDMWHPVHKEVVIANPHFVPFNFKKVGSHMKDADYGVIEIGSPMFDMEFVADDIILEKVRSFYANN